MFVTNEQSLSSIAHMPPLMARAGAEAEGRTVSTSITAPDPLAPLLQAQRLAVDLAEGRGLSPDTSRHLTRSVVL